MSLRTPTRQYLMKKGVPRLRPAACAPWRRMGSISRTLASTAAALRPSPTTICSWGEGAQRSRISALAGVADLPAEVGPQQVFLLAAGDVGLDGEQPQLVQQRRVHIAVERVLRDGVVGLEEQQGAVR